MTVLESGGRCLVLDVFKGNIHEDVLQCNPLSEVPVERIYQNLKTKFKKLEYVPVPGHKRHGCSPCEGQFFEYLLDVDDFDESLVRGDPAQQYKRSIGTLGGLATRIGKKKP